MKLLLVPQQVLYMYRLNGNCLVSVQVYSLYFSVFAGPRIKLFLSFIAHPSNFTVMTAKDEDEKFRLPHMRKTYEETDLAMAIGSFKSVAFL
jgi:hypothetical protein